MKILSLALLGFLSITLAHAQDGDYEVDTDSDEAPVESPSTPPQVKRSGDSAQGSKASPRIVPQTNRSQIKSRYKKDGKNLDVDTD